MPVENEIKLILAPDFDESQMNGWKKIDISQGYLNDGPRLRRYGEDFVFTYKKWIDAEDLLVEIEQDLSEVDFNRLWPYCENRIVKTRYVKHVGDIEWVVDFLKDDQNQVYFVLAEAEMPEGMDECGDIPEEIKDFIIHTPQKGDERYTNKRLSDIEYARTVLQDINSGSAGKNGPKLSR